MPPEVVWTEAAREKLGLDPDPAGKPVHRRGLLADLADLAHTWTAFPDDRWSRRAALEHYRALRRRVVRADADTLAEARARVEELRAPAELALRVVLASLFPMEHAWARADAEACLALPVVPAYAELLLPSLADPALALGIVAARISPFSLEDPGLRALELVHALGPGAPPVLARIVSALEGEKRRKTDLRAVLDALSLVRSSEAAAVLTERLASADVKPIAGRYFRAAPELAVTALPPIAGGRSKVAEVARALLAAVVAEHPDLAERALPDLAAPARRALGAARAVVEAPRDEAAEAELPKILVEPPWRHKSARPLTVIEDLAVTDAAIPVDPRVHARDAWASRLHWVPNALVFSPRVALPVAHAWLHRAEDRAAADAWLRAFPEIAAVGLIPASLREPSAARLDAGRVLRFLAGLDRAAVDRAVARYDADVRAGAAEILALDPLHDCPFEPPKLPDFVGLDVLPRPALRASGRSLPRDAVRNLVDMLAFSSRAEPYAGLAIVRGACDPASLDALAWAIFEAWLAAGAPSRSTWPMDALALLGGDATARRLAAKIRSFAAERAFGRAAAGVDVLARIGTDVALMHLSAIAERTRFADLEAQARARLAEAARARGLDEAELADRTVPDLDLDPDGSKTLSYGPRAFRVGFDEHLDPFVHGPDGVVLRALPKPSKSDDADLARAAQEAWKALKTDVSAIAGGQIQRLEQAMIARRRWDLATFRAVLVAHPLLVHLVRRLLFSAAKESDAPTLFRVAEDRTFADAADAPVALDPAARVTIPHPLEIGADARAAWGPLFADYEILQPFPQLGREVFTPTAEERAGSELSRFLGARVETGKLFGLEHRGFRRAPGYGSIGVYQRALPGGLTAAFAVSPGVDLTNPAATPEQTLGSLVLKRNQGALAPLGELDPILFSEIVRDLALLVG